MTYQTRLCSASSRVLFRAPAVGECSGSKMMSLIPPGKRGSFSWFLCRKRVVSNGAASRYVIAAIRHAISSYVLRGRANVSGPGVWALA
jgi:hypothetical protein